MQEQISIVITSINRPNKALLKLAAGCEERGYKFIVIGDVTSPPDFQIKGCDFYSLERQAQTTLKYAKYCPQRHYARKNIGYLLSIKSGAKIIVDTDDDNIPYETFWNLDLRRQIIQVSAVEREGWLNVYRYFSDANIWPRGFPLNKISDDVPPFETLSLRRLNCPIQQGLADNDPDVDAIYRLVFPLPQNFLKNRQVALKNDVWCPFNSQNTTWWKDAFPLLYLPAYCSFRMTDIWRSFVAQKIAWANNWTVVYRSPTVRQERNKHNLMKDFSEEVQGYLYNEKICEELNELPIKAGVDNLTWNLEICYDKLVEMGVIEKMELHLLGAWIDDLKNII